MKGSYILLIELEEKTEIELGTGKKELDKGLYTYFGSAFGPGGLKRIQRHREVSKSQRDVRHWHIDYLSGLEASELVEAVRFPEKDIECDLSSEAEEKIDGFGSTDCGCDSHLAYFPGKEDAEAFIEGMKEKFL